MKLDPNQVNQPAALLLVSINHFNKDLFCSPVIRSFVSLEKKFVFDIKTRYVRNPNDLVKVQIRKNKIPNPNLYFCLSNQVTQVYDSSKSKIKNR
jgi:hypothetical protein